MKQTDKVLVANRGEIAMRIVQACAKLGLDFVCVYTEVDRASGHVRLARELGGDAAAVRISSYRDANELFSVADAAQATAIHPGYGFFSEDFRFALRATERRRKLVFIGPSWRVIRELGDKINTKRLARGLGVPTVPGSDKPIYDEMEAEEIADNLFAFQSEQGVERPLVLVKASAGGGGMGIEEVHDPDAFRQVFRRIRNYAKRQFGDDGVLVEQRVMDFNHLEVQVVADRHGHVRHFGTRNCSVQSSGHQKRIEVAPGFAPGELAYSFDAARVLEEIKNHSLAIAQAAGYDNVGTWEWIVTPKGDPFLMEVNTRIQVENGVSAIIARIGRREGEEVDLIAEQIRLGLGAHLETGKDPKSGFDQEDIRLEGVGIEYRLIAEDPERGFTPWTGRIDRFDYQEEPWLRVHSQVPRDEPYDIPTEYDPNLALAIVWGRSLAEAKERGLSFLDKLVLEGKDSAGGGLKSNVAFLREKTAHILEF
ncbi:MAG: biotin carboxylase N-terminal domain-containing protein [Thermodesulfobacteriota bacterium]